MKYEVLKGFIDKESGKPVEHGGTFECSEARFSEIQKKGDYLKPIKEPVKAGK